MTIRIRGLRDQCAISGIGVRPELDAGWRFYRDAASFQVTLGGRAFDWATAFENIGDFFYLVVLLLL